MRAFKYIVFGALALVAVSCIEPAPTPAARPGAQGAPGAHELKVTVRGDVPHPGEYSVPAGATLVALEEPLGIRADARRFSVTMIRQAPGRPEMRSTWRLDSLPKKSPGIVLAEGDTLQFYDRALYSLCATCPARAESAVEAALDKAEIAWLSVQGTRNWKAYSVRHDERELAAETLRKDAELHKYVVRIY